MNLVKEFTMRRPSDFHLHVRMLPMLRDVIGFSVRHFHYMLVMPNKPEILTAENLIGYRRNIFDAARSVASRDPHPLMTIKITPKTTAEMIIAASEAGAVAGKMYPDGVTTGSEGGMRDFDTAIDDTCAALAERGMKLLVHGQMPGEGIYFLDRERKFLPIVLKIARRFPTLRIVLEHISTRLAVDMVRIMCPKNIAATITLHHLLLTTNDVLDAKIHPHHFCLPVAQRPEDRNALLRAALSGNPKFFFGSDSAPWLVADKECADGCGGIFSAPVLIPMLIDIFGRHDALGKLENFTSRFGIEYYGLPLNTDEIRLEKREEKDAKEIPMEHAGIKIFCGGTKLLWRIV